MPCLAIASGKAFSFPEKIKGMVIRPIKNGYNGGQDYVINPLM
jgi:hypothetical protein